MTGTVVVTSRSFGTVDPAPRRDLEAAGLEVVRADPRHHRGELDDVLADAVAWIAGTSPVTDDLLAAAPRLRVLARYGVGVDAVDVAAATKRRVWVTNTPGANTEAVADLTVALMLAALRHVTGGVSGVRRGDWSPRRGRELGATTVGLVGLGRIGQAVANRVRAFGATVLAVDPQLEGSPVDGVGLLDLEAALARSDVLSLHAPGGGGVLLDAGRLQLLPRGATVVNTARADLVDEEAVADALRRDHMAAYAADTLAAELEDAKASPLMAEDLTDRVVVTPHLGAQTDEAVRRMGAMASANVLAVLAGHEPPHPVNRPER